MKRLKRDNPKEYKRTIEEIRKQESEESRLETIESPITLQELESVKKHFSEMKDETRIVDRVALRGVAKIYAFMHRAREHKQVDLWRVEKSFDPSKEFDKMCKVIKDIALIARTKRCN